MPQPDPFSLGYFSAVASIAVLGWGLLPGQSASRHLLVVCVSVLLAVAATLSMGSGRLVWPVLCLEAWILKCPRKYLVAVAVAGTVAVLCYVSGFPRSDALGMGFGGVVRRPIAALRIMGLFLGGPLSLVSRMGGTLAGCAGILVAAYLLALMLRRRSSSTDVVIHAMLTLYFVGVALSISIGRISPEWLAERPGILLPSRYFTPAFLFWASLFSLAVALALKKDPLARVAAATVGAVVVALTLGTIGGQISEPVHWSNYFRQMDAAASGFFIPDDDEETMAVMYPAAPRNRGLEYLRARRWSVFSEDRATWIGTRLQDRFSVLPPGVCTGYLLTVKAIGGSAVRVVGDVLVNQSCPGDPVEIVITRRDGVIVGLGRTTLPVFTLGGGKESGFLAYARIEGGVNDLLVYAGGPDHKVSLVTNVRYPGIPAPSPAPQK